MYSIYFGYFIIRKLRASDVVRLLAQQPFVILQTNLIPYRAISPEGSQTVDFQLIGKYLARSKVTCLSVCLSHTHLKLN